MDNHPEFLDSMTEYVESRLAEWEAAHPRPMRDENKRPKQAVPPVCKHANGHIMLEQSNDLLKLFVSTPAGGFFFNLNAKQIQALVEQLLTIESDIYEFNEWANGGDLTAWTTERSNVMQQWRKEFIAQNEHRVLNAEEVAK